MGFKDANREMAQALERAMELAGSKRNISRFARMLREKVGDAPDESAVRRWLLGAQVPAWALIAAAQVAETTIEELLGDKEEWTMDGHQRLRELENQVAEISETLVRVMEEQTSPLRARRRRTG